MQYLFTTQVSRYCLLTLQIRALIYPANIRHWPCVDSMLAHRLWRWPNIEPTHGQCPVFAGMEYYWDSSACKEQLFTLQISYCRNCFTVMACWNMERKNLLIHFLLNPLSIIFLTSTSVVFHYCKSRILKSIREIDIGCQNTGLMRLTLCAFVQNLKMASWSNMFLFTVLIFRRRIVTEKWSNLQAHLSYKYGYRTN